MSAQTAIELARYGFYVFPVKPDTKRPLTDKNLDLLHGVKDSTRDEELIAKWWGKHPEALVGVHTGRSGIVVLDVDVKVNTETGDILVDGFTSLDENWLVPDETFTRDSMNGLGTHFVYRAPEGVHLNRKLGYRGMKGVDRLAGEGYAIWTGGAPDKDLAPAPKWLCDESVERDLSRFEGSLREWFETLTPGEPNALMRKAMERAEEIFNQRGNDFTHGDAVERQFEVVRLASEGNPGAEEALEFIESLFLSREGAHSRPEDQWNSEWVEALQSAVENYGDLTDQVKSLPEYSINLVPASIPLNLVTEENSGKGGFSKLLGALVKETEDDNRIAAILWNAPATRTLARDWGLSFTFTRIAEARVRPEPTRENPRIEEAREREMGGDVRVGTEDSPARAFSLLSDVEREYLSSRPGYVERVVQTAKDMHYDQLPYFRSIAWVCASMAFSFKGFIPLTKTHKMGVNTWWILLGHSGTGKSTSGLFRDGILRLIFQGDPEDIVSFDLGDDSSPQGLHVALIERDHRASLFSADEAAGFFSTLGLSDWRSGIDSRITSWYGGYVAPTNKLSQKEMRGKSALTSFNMHMFGTPDKVTRVVTSEMFETGFMARVNWILGNPPRNDSSRFALTLEEDTDVEFEGTPQEIVDLATDLVLAVAGWEHAKPLTAADGVMPRLSAAYEKMFRYSEVRENFELVEPSVTRLSETMLKLAGISAMYRGDTVIQMEDALRAVDAIEEMFLNLHKVVAMVSAGDFQRLVEDIEQHVRAKGGRMSKAAILHRFTNRIRKDPRELESALQFLRESGILNVDETGKGIMFEINGG